MTITINIDVVKYLDKYTLWTLVESKLQYHVEDELMDFIEDTVIEQLMPAPPKLNIRKRVYFTIFVYGKIRWILLFYKHSSEWYEVVRVISPYEKDYNYF